MVWRSKGIEPTIARAMVKETKLKRQGYRTKIVKYGDGFSVRVWVRTR